jgi:hypothetical protein
MKQLRVYLIISFVFSGVFLCEVRSQITATAEVFAEVIDALSARETSQLNFGKFFPEQDGGEIHISPNGTRVPYGSILLSGGNYSVASYQVSGEVDMTYSILLPQTPIQITSVQNSMSMVVTDWESYPPAGDAAGLLAGGTQQVYVGAKLIVGSILDNPAGLYSGSYTITFSYN